MQTLIALPLAFVLAAVTIFLIMAAERDAFASVPSQPFIPTPWTPFALAIIAIVIIVIALYPTKHTFVLTLGAAAIFPLAWADATTRHWWDDSTYVAIGVVGLAAVCNGTATTALLTASTMLLIVAIVYCTSMLHITRRSTAPLKLACHARSSPMGIGDLRAVFLCALTIGTLGFLYAIIAIVLAFIPTILTTPLKTPTPLGPSLALAVLLAVIAAPLASSIPQLPLLYAQ